MADYNNYLRWVQGCQAQNPYQDSPQPYENSPQWFTYRARNDGNTLPTGQAQTVQPAQTYAGYTLRFSPHSHAYPLYLQYYQSQPHGIYNSVVSSPPVSGPTVAPPTITTPTCAQGYYYYYPYPTFSTPAATNLRSSNWYGRTPNEVQQDNLVVAAREGANDPQNIAPRDVSPDKLFWVRELDGQYTQRTFFTIENDLKPGRWYQSHDGSMYYVRLTAPAISSHA